MDKNSGFGGENRQLLPETMLQRHAVHTSSPSVKTKLMIV